MSKKSDNAESAYLPMPAVVKRVESISATEKLFFITCKEARAYTPGQFFMVGLPGYGEAPISVCAPYRRGKEIELCIRKAGNLTGALHLLVAGDSVWLRGAYGEGFNLRKLKGQDLLLIAGGIGLAPMRSLILKLLDKRDRFGTLTLLYGAKRAGELLFTCEFAKWKRAGLKVEVIVDEGGEGWNGSTGPVTELMRSLKITPQRTTAVIIGPPVMYRFVAARLSKSGLAESDILVSLERRMKCGAGKCGHCQINSSYVCQDGPVYNLGSLQGMGEAFL